MISSAQFCSTVFEGRAPTGQVSISCYVGGVRNSGIAGVSEDELVEVVVDELSTLLGIKGTPQVVRTRGWSRGLPQYTIGHAGRREFLSTSDQRLAGMFLTGNYLDGVSMAACMEIAGKTALHVSALLAKSDQSHVRFNNAGAGRG